MTVRRSLGGALLLLAIALAAPAWRAGAAAPSVAVYLTTANLSSALARQPDLRFAPAAHDTATTIRVDATQRYQRIDGFGGALTDTSAWLLATKLTPAARTAVLQRLFDPAQGIGMSFMRLPMAASDFTVDGATYSYDDLPAGQADPSLAHFSIAHDTAYIIPVLQAALRLNPSLKLMATPWSPPAWMKSTPTNALTGALRPDAYGPLAAYFVRFVQAYRQYGIPIYAISPQNEPGATPAYTGIDFPAEDEARFIAENLGPALSAAHLHTRILAYDSYWSTAYSTPDYPFVVMRDVAARRYLAGTAWHCYEGSPDVMTRLHDSYPHKDNYETECSSGIAHGDVAELVIASTRNWARGVILWNVALDTDGGPKSGSGCPGCIAPVIIDQQSGAISYTGDYYQLGQASTFVHPGAYRIASTSFVTQYRGAGYGCRSATSYGSHTVDNVAFQNPDGSIALLAYNAAPPTKTFTVRWHDQAFRYALPACATATFIWPGAGAGA